MAKNEEKSKDRKAMAGGGIGGGVAGIVLAKLLAGAAPTDPPPQGPITLRSRWLTAKFTSLTKASDQATADIMAMYPTATDIKLLNHYTNPSGMEEWFFEWVV